MPGYGWAERAAADRHGGPGQGRRVVTGPRPWLAVLAGLLSAAAAVVLLAVLPIWLGLPLWLLAVAGGWWLLRLGLPSQAQPLISCCQAGLLGVAVAVGRCIGHGAIGVLAGLLSVLLLASLLALLLPPVRRPVSTSGPDDAWDPHVAIGPPGASYVLQLVASPARPESAPRLVPGLHPGEQVWLWPSGWVLPAGGLPPEQDAADRYAVLAGHRHGEAGLWLLLLQRGLAYWLAGWQLAGWRDDRPWFELVGGGRLLAVDDLLATCPVLPQMARAGLIDVAGLLPPAALPPEIRHAAAGMPAIALQPERSGDELSGADPLRSLRHPLFRLWVADRDTRLSVAADDADALCWRAEQASLLIHAVDAAGRRQPWVWTRDGGVQPLERSAGEA